MTAAILRRDDVRLLQDPTHTRRNAARRTRARLITIFIIHRQHHTGDRAISSGHIERRVYTAVYLAGGFYWCVNEFYDGIRGVRARAVNNFMLSRNTPDLLMYRRRGRNNICLYIFIDRCDAGIVRDITFY